MVDRRELPPNLLKSSQVWRGLLSGLPRRRLRWRCSRRLSDPGNLAACGNLPKLSQKFWRPAMV